MNERSLKVLEYPKIITALQENCITQGGKMMAKALVPMTHIGVVQQSLDLTEEAVGMVLRNGRPPLAELADTDDYVHRAAIGAMLSMGELLRIASLLRVARDMDNYYYTDTQMDALVGLKALFEVLDPCEMLESEISRKVLTEDEMADNASQELSRIRREILVKNGRITEKLNGIISSTTNEKYLQERLITIRNNRYVVPVKQEYRNMIPGVVLDKSASGATLFIEPLSVVELNNDLKELAIEEEKEMVRILKLLSQKVAMMQAVLTEDHAVLTELDFIYAKAKYALAIGGERVSVAEDGEYRLLRARHPLLDPKKAVASDIVLDEAIHTMIITGPNTGGKTVTLKTMGLLSLMVQSGLFIPVREGSSLRLFQEVYADIGDEQSIEQSLSTFSSHMTNIVSIMKTADAKSLVLFDELGAGTDPTEGAALAIAILDTLHQRGGLTAATTHYSELKEYALVTPGITNASVEFDVATLRPTYRLLIGVPGKSNAFQIASRLGLEDDIIEAARSTIEVGSIQFEETLEKLEENRHRVEAEAREMRLLREEAEALRVKAQKEQESARRQSEALLTQAREESARIVAETKEKTDEIYKEIRYIQENTEAGLGDNKKLEALRKGISDQEKGLYATYKKKVKSEKKKKPARAVSIPIEKGTPVHIYSLHQDGEVLEILKKEKKYFVQVGMLKMKINMDDAVAIQKEAPKTVRRQKPITSADRHAMETRLDLRGRNGEESLFLVEKMISDALVSGTHQLVILHGKGTGKLRQVIQAYLKDNPHVEDFRMGAPHEGGDGVTIVTL